MNDNFIVIAVVLILLILGYLMGREFFFYLKERKSKLPKGTEEKKTPLENVAFKKESKNQGDNVLPAKSPDTSNDLLELKTKAEERIQKLELENKKLYDELYALKNNLEWQERKIGQLNQQLEREKNKPITVADDEQKKQRIEIRELKHKNDELQTKLANTEEILHKLQEKNDDFNIIFALYERLRNRRKINELQFQEFIKAKNIFRLFHVTERANLGTIKKYGLLSWHFIEEQRLFTPEYVTDRTSKELDYRYNLQDYVRLSFTENIPMMHVKLREGVAKDLVVLYIDKVVMLWQDTLFCDRNATANDAKFGEAFDDLTNIRFNIVLGKTPYYELSEVDKAYYQAEVMVKTHIPRKYILNLESPKDFKR